MSITSKVPYILSHLTEDDVEWLLAAGEQREIPAGTMLIAEGQPADALFIVLDGVLAVSIAALDGQEIDRIVADEEPRFLTNVHLAGVRFERLLNRMRNAAIITLTGNDLTIENVVQVAYHDAPVQLSSLARERMVSSRAVVDELAQGPDPIYGLTTGLGALKGLRITTNELRQFQRNILLSHAAGVGPDYSVPVVRPIM